jgi:hypothetical protein
MERKKYIPIPKKRTSLRVGLAGLAIGGGMILSSQRKDSVSNPSSDAPIVMQLNEEYILSKLNIPNELINFVSHEDFLENKEDYLPFTLPIKPIQGPIPPSYGERVKESIKIVRQKVQDEEVKIEAQKEAIAEAMQAKQEAAVKAAREAQITSPVEASGEGRIQPLSSTTSGYTVWDELANECESGGNWSINTGNGFYGGLQISEDTWIGEGGLQYAQYPNQATREQQIAIAEKILADQGWGAWPGCSAKLGL